MNSSVKAIFSLIIFGFAGTGIYSLTIKALEYYRSEDNASYKKQVSVKPANIREKQKQVEPVSAQDEFTFFDTLNDPSMTRFVGLSGDFDESDAGSNSLSEVSAFTVKNKPVAPPVEAVVENKSVSIAKETAPAEPVRVSSAGFAIQVSSFRDTERAGALKEKLRKKGYPAFLMAARIPGKNEVWHRVFIGRYADKETALNAAAKVKETERLAGVVVWQEGSRP
ncbi:hypothetical protein UR09_00835 [Candidatus Nitromaritima sp. SCGC AAA799-A02]|nr:hypothetical protein UR09_00835 [Candidatus Nitromaritima sp. SCGC AAA799-A02]